jgi:hypothetical protein
VEISYTRIISYKLYYYTYLVIGLALLGIGAGGVLVAVSRRARRAETEIILVWSLLLGAASVFAGYIVVALPAHGHALDLGLRNVALALYLVALVTLRGLLRLSSSGEPVPAQQMIPPEPAVVGASEGS